MSQRWFLSGNRRFRMKYQQFMTGSLQDFIFDDSQMCCDNFVILVGIKVLTLHLFSSYRYFYQKSLHRRFCCIFPRKRENQKMSTKKAKNKSNVNTFIPTRIELCSRNTLESSKIKCCKDPVIISLFGIIIVTRLIQLTKDSFSKCPRDGF